MATKREESAWPLLTFKVKAIREMGMARARDLAEAIDSPEQRVTEWINGKKEPRAGKTLLISSWVAAQEAAITKARRTDEYLKIQKRLSK